MSEALSLSGTGNNSINPVTSHCYSKFCITSDLYILILHTYVYPNNKPNLIFILRNCWENRKTVVEIHKKMPILP